MSRPHGAAVPPKSPLGFDERFQPGTLTWVQPATAPAAEDRLVTTAFHFLVDPAGVTPAKARELGRTIGRQAQRHALADYLEAFSHLGIGRVTLSMLDQDRYLFVGHDLRGSSAANAPACALALGFLEGAVEAVGGQPTLGAEMQCRSRGHEKCSFTIMARR